MKNNNDLEQIALEKAGIMRGGRPVVIADPGAPRTLWTRAEELGAQVVEPDPELRLPETLPVGLIPGNVRGALTALAQLSEAPDTAALERGLAGLSVAGRRELRSLAGIDYLLDVAHNPDAVGKLLEFMSASGCNGKTLCVYAALGDKDVDGIVGAAAKAFDAWFLAALPGVPRAAEPRDIAAGLHAAGQGMISVSKNVRQAFRRAQSLLEPGDRLVVFGSFHTVAAVMPLLDKDQRKLVS